NDHGARAQNSFHRRRPAAERRCYHRHIPRPRARRWPRTGSASINAAAERAVSKVPAVTLTFWIIKIAATTLGETGGDTVSMTLNWGYLLSSLMFLAVLIAFVGAQISAKRFHPLLYWATIVASTTAGTTLADFADRSLGIGYPGGSLLLLTCVLVTLALWYRTEGSVSVSTVNTPRAEACYWATTPVSGSFTGPRSRFRRPWVRPWATGRPIRVLATAVGRCCSARPLRSSRCS